MSENKPMTDFDKLTTPATYHMLKACIPLLPEEKQKFFAILIKFFELQSVMQYYNHHKCSISSSRHFSLSDILQVTRIYMDDKTAQNIEMFTNVMNIMETMKEFGGGNLDGMIDMLAPDQKEMFETFTAMNQNMKGEEKQNE